MGINLDKMKQERARKQGAGDLLEVPEGETNCYICPPSREDDDVPYTETKMHYGLGPNGKNQAMCLEPSVNPLISKPAFQEQLKELGKDLSGGCGVCEAQDRGEKVSGDATQDGKASGRYFWIVIPVSTRGDARQQFRPWPQPDEVKGLNAPYRVWDGIMDAFGQCGDITDPEAATYVRIIRNGKGISTQWTTQPDIESVKKPVKLSNDTRLAIAEATKPGGECDPYRLLASMARTKADQINLIKGTAGDGSSADYDETPKDGGSKKEGFKPPGPGAKPAAKTQAQTSKSAAKPAATTAKADPGKAGKEHLKLVQERGAPPTCFKADPDPAEQVCLDCPWNKECFEHCGVPLPEPVPKSAKPAAKAGPKAKAPDPEPEAVEPEPIPVEECEQGAAYVIDGTAYVYKGPAKGKHYFALSDGTPKKVEPGAMVTPVPDDEPSGAEPEPEPEAESAEAEDQKLDELEKALAASKAKKAK